MLREQMPTRCGGARVRCGWRLRSCRLRFRGDSDVHIVRGLIAILFAIYQDKTPEEILATDARGVLAELGLQEHLTPQRSNGFAAMIERIRADARAVASAGVGRAH